LSVFAPCEWPLVTCSGSPSGESGEAACPHLDNLAPEIQDAIIAAAVDFCWEATGRRYGLCETTVRPCNNECEFGSTYEGYSGAPAGGLYGWFGGGSWWGPIPFLSGGQWFNAECGCQGACGHMDYVKLPGPVNEVLEVYIDGALFTDWILDSYGLGRTDGQRWPREQDQRLPLTDNNTFGVIYNRGLPVPAGGQLAAGTMACQLARWACNDGSCQLPRRVTNITREGTTVAFSTDDFQMLFSEASTGIWVIDSWIASVNRSARKRSRVLSANARPMRRTPPL
jgi:hypothetical protein